MAETTPTTITLPVGATVRELTRGGRTNRVQYSGVIMDHEIRYRGWRGQERPMVLIAFAIDDRYDRRWMDPRSVVRTA